MRRTRYQFGSVQRKPRKLGPDIWVYRFTDETGKKRSVEIGDMDRYPTKAQALKAAERLRMNANPDRAVQRGSTFGALLDRYIAERCPCGSPPRTPTALTFGRTSVQSGNRTR